MNHNTGHEPKPNVQRGSFRTTPVQQRSIWESWAVLPARTRLYISLGITGFALAGVIISDQLETALPPPPKTDQIAEGATKDVPPP